MIVQSVSSLARRFWFRITINLVRLLKCKWGTRSGEGLVAGGSGGRANAGKIGWAGVGVKATLEGCMMPPKPWEANNI